MSGGFVYFIRCIGGGGPIKIGFSQSPIKRMRALSLWSPYPLEIAATLPGSFETEARFHIRHSDAWFHGEWFHETDSLAADIKAVKAGVFDRSLLPNRYGGAPTDKREMETSASYFRRLIMEKCQKYKMQPPLSIVGRVERYEALPQEDREVCLSDMFEFFRKIETKKGAKEYLLSIKENDR